MENVSICINPPDIATMIKAKRVVCILTSHEGEEAQIALLHESDETLEDITGATHPICAFQNKKIKFQSHIAEHLDSTLEQGLVTQL
jgi:hypothetical protein